LSTTATSHNSQGSMNHINMSPNHITMNFNQNPTISTPVLSIQTIPVQQMQNSPQITSPMSITNPNGLQPTTNKIVPQQYQEVPKQSINRTG
jgi:hypothetical protein